jgi:hypothetical protein
VMGVGPELGPELGPEPKGGLSSGSPEIESNLVRTHALLRSAETETFGFSHKQSAPAACKERRYISVHGVEYFCGLASGHNRSGLENGGGVENGSLGDPPHSLHRSRPSDLTTAA